MKLKKLLTGTLVFAGLVGVVSTPLLVVSCSDSQKVVFNYDDKKVSEVVDAYRREFDKAANAGTFFCYTDEQVPQIISVIDEYIEIAGNMSFYNLSVDGRVWLDSFMDELLVKKQLVESNIHYLIITPWYQLGFTNYSGWLANKISWTIQKVSNENLDDSKIPEIEKLLTEFNAFIANVQKNLTDGLAKGVTISLVMAKHAIGNLLQQGFMTPFLDKQMEGASINSYQAASDADILPFRNTKLNSELVENANKGVLGLVQYLTQTYYKGIKYGGNSTEIGKAYTLTKKIATDVIEEDNGYQWVDQQSKIVYKFSNLGLSEQDLEQKDIGLGFMNDEGGFGKKIYNALIRYHSNTEQSAAQIFALGSSAVAQIKQNMQDVAKIIAEIYVGPNETWSPKGEYYDKDSSGTKYGAELADDLLTNIVSSDGRVDLSKFFIWMNTNRWFNGRDMLATQFPTMDGSTYLKSKYLGSSKGNPLADETTDGKTPYLYTTKFVPKNKNITPVLISDVIGDKNNPEDETKVWGDAGNLAYKYLVKGLSPATIQSSNIATNNEIANSISPEAAFIGTSHAIEQYLQYKDVSVNHFNGLFKSTSVDYTLRTGTGGAAYANSGKGSWSYSDQGWGGFYLDSNPYFGLQKWSMTTLATHEGVSGHVFQFNYAHDHPGSEFAPEFSSTAYAEGWGLFSEWLAVQIGMYGEPVALENAQSNKLALPKFGVNSKNIDVTQFDEQYEYANGAYWIDDDKSTPDVIEQPGNSQKLFDATQYFGFLNERQLRAMRCAVDVGIHAGGSTINESDGEISSIENAGKFTPGTGWSLKQARAYLKGNSGLGIDDINRETKRYLEYTGQAVSYYNGVVAMENLFMKALDKYQKNHQEQAFLDWSNTLNTNNNTAGLFDIMLRNNDIPLEVLTKVGEFYILNNYN